MSLGEGADLGHLIARVRRRWQYASWLTTAGYAAAGAAVPLAATGAIAQLAGQSGALLVLIVILGLGGSVAVVSAVAVRRRARPDDRQVARFIGERVAAHASGEPVGDAIASAVEVVGLDRPRGPRGSLLRSGGRACGAPMERPAGAFDRLVVSRAVEVLREVEPRVIVPTVEMRRAWVVAIAGIGLLLVAVAAAAPHLQRAAGTVWLALVPHSLEITVATGDVRLPAGQPLHIAASIGGRGARWLSTPPSLVVSADGQQQAVEMNGIGAGTYEYTFEAVDRSFAYRVTAGGTSTRQFDVTALHPPRVTRIDLHYRYPAFTGLPPRQDVDGGDIYGPAGSAVRLLVHADKPLAGGSLVLGDGGLVSLSSDGGTDASADLVIERDGAYRVRLVDTDGLSARGDTEYFIRVMNDRPPDVRIVRPAADQGIMPLQEIVIEARADDDHGIASFDLVYTVAGREPQTVPFAEITGTVVARTGRYTLEAEALGVQPGDVITYYARARDVPRGRRSIETQSDIFFLEVKPFAEEFAAAESQAMGGGATGTQIDGLIAAQKAIISATWNLERRSTAGRSAADLEAVGRAQAELKARTERMLVPARGGRRGGVLQQIRQLPGRAGGSGDHLGAAVAAMARAADELARQSTAAAIPHETAALQALLRAQAETRRRQVLQQAAGAAGGSSRSDRDLSTLFDRELQRQQRTAYETPPRPPSADPEQEADLADRLRDLARRQEDIARGHREVAEGTSPAEERKRRLERLAREQQEIRQQLEEIARRQPGDSGGASGGAGTVRDAADAMRQAAEAAGRQSAGDAAASGERAAQALREAERQVRGDTPEGRRRTAGALQLEAQQIADAQRRLSRDAARLGADARAGAPTTEPRRRLAGEQDRLADRVEALERSARELARQLPDGVGARVGDALAHLETEQVAPRMRAEAEALRGAEASADRRTDPDGRLARALESLADTLRGDRNGQARRASDDLNRTRELRRERDALERAVRDADGKENEAALARAREAYARAQQALRDLRGGTAGWTPEHHEVSQSSPGTEAFKQDFSDWEVLRKDLDRAIQHYEAAAIERVRAREADDRLSAGGSHAVPHEYRPAVARYFEALAKTETR
jgi:hypothetical protein